MANSFQHKNAAQGYCLSVDSSLLFSIPLVIASIFTLYTHSLSCPFSLSLTLLSFSCCLLDHIHCLLLSLSHALILKLCWTARSPLQQHCPWTTHTRTTTHPSTRLSTMNNPCTPQTMPLWQTTSTHCWESAWSIRIP